MSTSERDRLASPSINFPRSEDEAAQAVLHSIQRALFGDRHAPLGQIFTLDAGFGYTRTQQQVDWLNNQRAILAAQFEALIDSLDVRNDRG